MKVGTSCPRPARVGSAQAPPDVRDKTPPAVTTSSGPGAKQWHLGQAPSLDPLSSKPRQTPQPSFRRTVHVHVVIFTSTISVTSYGSDVGSWLCAAS